MKEISRKTTKISPNHIYVRGCEVNIYLNFSEKKRPTTDFIIKMLLVFELAGKKFRLD